MATDYEQAYLESLSKIANHDKVIKACEPNVFSHRTITENDVLRVLAAQKLINDGLKEKNRHGYV